GVGAVGSVMLPIKGTTSATACSPAVGELVHNFFAEGWYLRDPRNLTIPKLLATGVSVDFDAMSPEEMQRSEFYDFMGRCGYRYFAALRIDAGEDNIWALSLQRRLGEEPFSPSEQAYIASWSNRLSNAATLAAEVSKVRAAALTGFFEQVAKPALLLDR